MPRNALGRGLSALIREPEPLQRPQPLEQLEEVAVEAKLPKPVPSEGLLQADIDLIDPSPYQPRTRFREEPLAELARSIQSSGIVQPLVVRRIGDRFQLIAGERRWRAAQRAGLTRVPVVLRHVTEEMALEMTLVENLQREDLNPIEQARAFQKLIDEFGLTQEQVAERTGKDRTTIANAVRLLRLEEPILDLLEEGRLTPGHGRALLSVSETTTRLGLARRIARGGMSVRQVERLATRSSREREKPPAADVDPNMKAAVDELQRKYGTRVTIHPVRADRPGELVFEYYDNSSLADLYERFMKV